MYREDGSTLDLQIEDMDVLLSLLHVIHLQVYYQLPCGPSFMSLYKHMKFKMKLAYEAWSHNLEVGTLIHYAVLKTLQQKLRDTTRCLQEFVRDPAFNH